MPKISVVMPTYNREGLIQNAIRSIIDQTFKNWEMIIVDDGSEDGTQRVVESFAHPDVRYIKVPHCGNISILRNLGNKEAKGELIVVQDSDDQSMPNRLQEIWDAYQKTNADLIYHGMYLRFYDPYHNAIVRNLRPAKPFDKEHLLKEQYIPGQVAYKREKILQFPYDEEVLICDDYMMLLNFALNGQKFYPIPLYLYDYVDTPDSVNINGELDGRRKHDTDIIMKRLKEKYNL